MNKTYPVNLGITLGIISIAIFLFTAIISGGMIFSAILGLLSIAAIIGLPIIFVSRQRKAQNNSISFKEAFITAFGGLVLAGIISSLFSLIYVQFIDTGYIDQMVNQQLETMATFLKGAGEEVMIKTLTETEEKIRNGFTVTGIITGFGIQVALYAVFALILGAVMKRESSQIASENILDQ